MQNSIEHSFSTQASAGEIWNSLTDRDELENWWGEGIILEPKVGGRFLRTLAGRRWGES